MERLRLVFSGSGGQGVITAAIILAEAAVLHENLLATQTQTYGPEARGGATRSDVIIADSEIYFPKVIQPNVLVCLTQEAYMKFYDIVRPGGLLITDPRHVTILQTVDSRQIEIPMHAAVMDNIGDLLVYNICMLGALLALTQVVSIDSVIKVLETRMPPSSLPMNRRAMDLGIALGAKHNV
ncbi:MAG: 2-oxoacid:acceptor oxidoreductase family protein [Proteobacteria bacterium]|nr:2-oxoacid:acceptor oxidoreductase family protein [Pseudomonadota bacterium]